ncbi:MAG: hypothetical protein PW786_10980 [Arachidicoccus sp.]|nr:hypothetical protein [Arachidicoccus sp.]
MRNTLIIGMVLFFILSCKKLPYIKATTNETIASDKWEAKYLKSKITIELKKDSLYEMFLPYILKKGANNPAIQGCVHIIGHYHNAYKRRVLDINSLLLLKTTPDSSSITGQEVRKLLKNLATVLYKTNEVHATDSLEIKWYNNQLIF